MAVDNIRFSEALAKIYDNGRDKNGIGTLSEKNLHAVLKAYYEPFSDCHEIKIGRYVADICGEDGVVEIQTRNLGTLNKKLELFLDACRVTVVYPLASTKWLSWIDMQTGELSPKRKSPKSCRIYDAIPEMYRIKFHLANPRFALRLCFLDIEEYRYKNGWSKDGKKGSERCDRKPVRMVRDVIFCSPSDYMAFLPEGLPEEFSSSDVARCAKITKPLASTLMNILTYIGCVKRVSHDKKGYHYQKAF